MSATGVIKTVEQLSYRVSQLEGQDYRFWLPVAISLVAVAVSLYAAHKSKHSADAQLKRSAMQEIKTSIASAKAQLEQMSMELAPLRSSKKRTPDQESEFEIKIQVYNSVVERLLNAYNDGCMMYYKGQVERQEFVDLFHQDIALYVANFPDKFSGPLTRFDSMVKYYTDKHKNARA